MLAQTLLAMAALAVQATAADGGAGVPYRAGPVHKMSVRELFGVVRRQADNGYKPAQSVCGAGNTCAEACGAGYETCASDDGQAHCYNPAVKQICCPDLSGDSCDPGYYCTKDDSDNTWCCPNAMNLAACAAAFHVSGSLVSEAPTTASSTSGPAPSFPPSTANASSTTPSASAPTGSPPFPPANSTASRPPSAPTATVSPPVVARSSHVAAGDWAGLVLVAVATAFVML